MQVDVSTELKWSLYWPQIFSQLLPIVAVAMCFAVGDYDGAAALAAMACVSELLMQHTVNIARVAVDAAIFRVKQCGTSADLRDHEPAYRSVPEEGTSEVELLRGVLREEPSVLVNAIDSSGATVLTRVTVCWVGSQVICCIAMVTIPWVATTSEVAVGWTRTAAVVCVIASPRAILASKVSALWSCMALFARRGMLSQECIAIVKRGSIDSSAATPAAHQLSTVSQLCQFRNRVAATHICLSFVGKLTALAVVLSGISTPWHAAAVELAALILIILNAARCAIVSLVLQYT
jgi:hypothetical protein